MEVKGERNGKALSTVTFNVSTETGLSKPARVQETRCMVYFFPLRDGVPVTKSTKDSTLLKPSVISMLTRKSD